MSYIDGKPLNQIKEIPNPKAVYETLMEMLFKFVEVGIIHGDYNEFNLLLDQKGKVFVIDFPQIISVNHPDAQLQFNRDVNCIQSFFEKRYQIHFENTPKLGIDVVAKSDLTKDVVLSGCIKELLGDRAKDIQLLDTYHQEEKTTEQEDDKEAEEEMEPAKELKWEAEERSSEESDEDIAEERVPIDKEVEAEVEVEKKEDDKTIETAEETKKGEINIAEIKAKVKKQFKNSFKKEKLKRAKNKVKKKSKGKDTEKVHNDELF
eukprot:TRINITY_DN3657_c0_g2_i3.p3 TRINITY_DN3657_c0_g2~~TRINITY_DN3657_c0_g2_i3.p3  ORF type:complete len:263 (+),score=113.53 TRINITY_DN3657_c0_g2_i3:667-1455(+)